MRVTLKGLAKAVGAVLLAICIVAVMFTVAVQIAWAGPAAGPAVIPSPAPGHFGGKLALVVEFKKGYQPEIRSGRTLWALERPFYYRTKAGDLITVPAGMTTDLASIPALASPALPPDGPWLAAAMVHDECYLTRGTMLWKGHVGHSAPAPYTRAGCDDLLDEAMAALGVGVVQRVTIFEGVRVGGAKAFGT